MGLGVTLAPGRTAQAQSPAWGSPVAGKTETQDEIELESKLGTIFRKLGRQKAKNQEL